MAAERELSPRALLTGLLLGAALTPCNVYSGLKIGWSFNMSIAALLAGLAFWRAAERAAAPDAARDELKRTRADLLPGAGNADDRRLAPALVTALERRPH